MGSNTFSACLRLQLATLLLLSSSGASSALAAGSTSASAAACPTGAAEHRTYEIVVDKKPAGAYSLNIAKLPDGSISVTSKASVRVKVLFFTYGYDYAGHEVWKNDRLVAFDSQSQENGKKTNVKVATEGERISYTINGGKPRYATAETRTSSYWQLPSSTTSGEFSSGFIEVDTGRTFSKDAKDRHRAHSIRPEKFSFGDVQPLPAFRRRQLRYLVRPHRPYRSPGIN